MTPKFFVQIFRRHRPWLTLRGWAFLGGVIAGSAIVFAIMVNHG